MQFIETLYADPLTTHSQQTHLFPTMSWTDWITVVWGGVGLLIFVRLVVGIGAVWHISTMATTSVVPLNRSDLIGIAKPVSVLATDL